MKKNINGNLGIFIGRLNPPHIGHIKIIKKSLQDNLKTIIFLGSANVIDEKNPFDFEIRKMFLENCFDSEINKKLIIDYLDDFPSDSLWVEKLGERINILHPKFSGKLNFYFGDFENDSAIKAINEHKYKLEFKNIGFVEISRKELKEVSSTNLREALKLGNYELVSEFLPKEIYDLVIKLWKN